MIGAAEISPTQRDLVFLLLARNTFEPEDTSG